MVTGSNSGDCNYEAVTNIGIKITFIYNISCDQKQFLMILKMIKV